MNMVFLRGTAQGFFSGYSIITYLYNRGKCGSGGRGRGRDVGGGSGSDGI